MKAKNKSTLIRIKNILWANDLDVAKLARCIGRSRTWTSQVLYGHKNSFPTRRAIAQVLDMTVEDIWPNKRRAA